MQNSDGLTLCESSNDGKVSWKRVPGGVWNTIDSKELDEIVSREKARREFNNEWIGKYRGKTIVIFGCGPMLRHISPKFVKWMADNDDIVIAGVNAAPAICKNIWKLDPAKVFDFVFGADFLRLDALGHDTIKVWSWDKLKGVTKFRSAGEFDGDWVPVVGSASPTIVLPELWWSSSICGAACLAAMALATPSPPKYCHGPDGDWPEVRANEPGDGKIILVGLEMNSDEHAYVEGDKGMEAAYGLTLDGSVTKDGQIPPYDILERFTKDLKVKILNAASWSAVKAHDFCDLFDELGYDKAKEEQGRLRKWLSRMRK